MLLASFNMVLVAIYKLIKVTHCRSLTVTPIDFVEILYRVVVGYHMDAAVMGPRHPLVSPYLRDSKDHDCVF